MKYKFKTEPYGHQLEALKRSWDKEEFAYFMEMGTGKSKVLIDNIAVLYDRGKINAAIIIAPKGVYENWSGREIPTHLPDHVIHRVGVWNPNPTKKEKEKLLSLFDRTLDLKILVTSSLFIPFTRL